MKKTTKLIVTLILITLITLLSFNITKAHTVELDPDSLISFPNFIFGGEGKISIKLTDTNYKLYWQLVEISKSDYTKIEEIQDAGKKDLTDKETEMKNLKTEYENLKSTKDEKKKEYDQAVADKLTESEISAAKDAYDVALKNYNDKVTEYNSKVDEYNKKVNEVNDKVKELIPAFVENNWSETTDGNFKVDLSNYSGEKVFVVWAKLVFNGKTSYDEVIYTMNGTKSEDIKVTAVSLDKTEITVEEGSNYNLLATITPNDATNKNIKWSSDNKDVATVENGKVVGVKEGTATITVQTEDGEFTATCKVSVTKKSDNTTADKNIPQTGTTATMTIVISSIIFIGVIACLACKKYNGIK